MRLVLCRHAAAGDARGAADLAAALRGHDVAAVYTSPLTRALETARAVAEPHGLSPEVREDLREIELGDVDGLQFEDYPTELQEALLTAPATVSFPGGESYELLRTRVVAALEELTMRHDGQTIGVISHAGPIRAALATWLSVSPGASFRIGQSFGAVNVVDWHDGAPFVQLVNGVDLQR
jgi:broad specificity phosphatase PhoE